MVDLRTGQSISVTADLTIPATMQAGPKYWIANIDPDNQLNESSELNNTISHPVTVLRLSGSEWEKMFPPSKSLSDLNPAFALNIAGFIAAVEAGGASVNIISTLRPRERAYLMHYSWRIANEHLVLQR